MIYNYHNKMKSQFAKALHKIMYFVITTIKIELKLNHHKKESRLNDNI